MRAIFSARQNAYPENYGRRDDAVRTVSQRDNDARRATTRVAGACRADNRAQKKKPGVAGLF
jgi:hypothetical protein